MDRQLLDNINAAVLPSDTLYHLGDFARYHRAIAAYRSRIRCRNVVLVLGNHDPQTRGGEPKMRFLGMFSRVYVRLRIRPAVGGVKRTLVLSHNAMRTWDNSHRGSWHLFGHSHGQLPVMPRTLDVGVDVHGFRPISLPEVASIIESREVA